jgi:rabankyrin-5
VAILNQHSSLIEILLRQTTIDLKIKNNSGQTPFATALMHKNNNATCLILKKDPNAAEQVNKKNNLKKKKLSNDYIDKLYFKVDNKGRNFLHIAVQNSDIETVLSLISVNVNINSRVKDNQSKTGLHLAAEAGSEMIIRNLVRIAKEILHTIFILSFVLIKSY